MHIKHSSILVFLKFSNKIQWDWSWITQLHFLLTVIYFLFKEQVSANLTNSNWSSFKDSPYSDEAQMESEQSQWMTVILTKILKIIHEQPKQF